MSLSADKVVAASNAWVWIPDNATTAATPEYLLVRFPDYFDHPLELLRFNPAEASEGALPAAVETVLDRAYVDGAPLGAAAVTMADGAARLWFASVLEPARGHSVYRALLTARLAYGAAHGATMGLVKGRVSTSGPILWRAGFNAYGQETLYRVPLA